MCGASHVALIHTSAERCLDLFHKDSYIYPVEKLSLEHTHRHAERTFFSRNLADLENTSLLRLRVSDVFGGIIDAGRMCVCECVCVCMKLCLPARLAVLRISCFS